VKRVLVGDTDFRDGRSADFAAAAAIVPQAQNPRPGHRASLARLPAAGGLLSTRGHKRRAQQGQSGNVNVVFELDMETPVVRGRLRTLAKASCPTC